MVSSEKASEFQSVKEPTVITRGELPGLVIVPKPSTPLLPAEQTTTIPASQTASTA